MKRDITPLTHTIESYRNAKMTWTACLAELIDNALSWEKGDAHRVVINIQKKEVRVYDDGQGIDDVSRVLRPGDSGTWTGSSDIGLYGIGATQALTWMGCESEVHTIREGMYSRAVVDWNQLLRKRRSARWEAQVDDFGAVGLVDPQILPEELRGQRHGTLLIARRRIPGRRSPRVGEIHRTLGRIFTPALRTGREVSLHSGSSDSTYSLESLNPPTLAIPVKVEGIVDGKPYQGEVGILEQTDSKISGIWFGYQHRMIVRKGAADIPGLPTNVYGYIELGTEWRKSLSTFKDDIVRDVEPLLKEIRLQIADVIEEGSHWNKDLKVEWLRAKLAGVLFQDIGERIGMVEVNDKDEVVPRPDLVDPPPDPPDLIDPPVPPIPEVITPDSVKHSGDNPRDEGSSDTGIRIESDPGREPCVWTDIGESNIVVSFDPHHPHFEKSLEEPLNCPAFYGAIGASFASSLASKEPEQISRIFPALKGRVADDSQLRFVAIFDEFTRRTGSLKERPTMAQIEKDVLE